MKKSSIIRKISDVFPNVFLTCITISIDIVSLFAQQRKLVYDVVRGGHIIGKINFVEINNAHEKTITFNSDIKTSFIFSFIDMTTEESVFRNDTMVHSSFYQNQTGSGKTNSFLEVQGNGYRYIEDGNSKLINGFPIYYSTLLLYIKPPLNIAQAYSQKFQKFLLIKKIKENKYRLILPDGKYNDYSYTNGTCNKVSIVRSFFNVELVLRE